MMATMTDTITAAVTPPIHAPHTPTPSSDAHRHRQRHSKRFSVNFPVLVPTVSSPAKQAPSLTDGPWIEAPATGHAATPSPTRLSPRRGTVSSAALPLLTPPRESVEEPASHAPSTDAPDFLTLLAGRERRVLELREELQRAETDLHAFKRQWATYEAQKKKGEMKSKSVQLGPMSPHDKKVTNLTEGERARRREVLEKKVRGLGIHEPDGVEGNLTSNDGSTAGSGLFAGKKSGQGDLLTGGRRGGQRVFEGRHTRTLSLLTHGGTHSARAGYHVANKASPDGTAVAGNASSNSTSASSTSTSASTSTSPTLYNEIADTASPSLSRPQTQRHLTDQSISSVDSMNLGKTYKDLASAASRRSLPPGAGTFVKQGKQVYEGVSQGFWSFVEDIRQATVGEEAVHGVPLPSERDLRKMNRRRTSSTKAPVAVAACERHGKKGDHCHDTCAGTNQHHQDKNKNEKDNFWKEFGIETPKQQRSAGTSTHDQKSASMHQSLPPTAAHPGEADDAKSTPASSVQSKPRSSGARGREHAAKASTDSQNPPSLLAELPDGPDDDEAWDNWTIESPVSAKRSSRGPVLRRDSQDDGVDRRAPNEEVLISWSASG